ncbi:MAG: RsmB/NOP family class I SAM-dependent RNA methyltransferase [Magnetococcales bacterium]|nr:RsmB/NOP family class I SAM-dependent RNA methyltransferase [Magnetococcales bacterium]
MGESILQEAGLLLQRILPDGQPGQPGAAADQVLEQFFRAHHTGSRERAYLAELVYHVLRHRRSLAAMLREWLPAAAEPDAMQLAVAAGVVLQAGSTAQLQTLLGLEQEGGGAAGSEPVRAWAARCPQTVAERLSLPDWLWYQLVEQWGEAEAESLGLCLNQAAQVDLRVNTLRATREGVMQALVAAQIVATPTPYAPTGLRLAERRPLGGLDSFKQGWFELQDEGSQLIAPLLAVRPGETVVDLCAGGGGKSLHLAALMGNRGRIVATDTDEQRLARLGGRSKRAGVRIVRTIPLRHERDPKLKPLEGRADAVLVDAPCSGIGTLRRHPELKWRLQASQVEAYHYRQCALLEAGARLTRPGGRLLYVTCSLLQRENQAVVAAFLADNKNFALRPLPMVALLPQSGPYFVLLPHQTATDGFFGALLQRRS